LLFSEALVENQKIQYCSRCDTAFMPGKMKKYCSKKCGHIDSALKSKKKKQSEDNSDRLRVASHAIGIWINRRSRRDWRSYVENVLTENGLFFGQPRKSQWLGRCIRAAFTEDNSPQRARLAELCTGPGASKAKSKEVLKDLANFYALIRTPANSCNSPRLSSKLTSAAALAVMRKTPGVSENDSRLRARSRGQKPLWHRAQ
jgi:hypothetical protein